MMKVVVLCKFKYPGGNFSDLNSNNQWDVGEPFMMIKEYNF